MRTRAIAGSEWSGATLFLCREPPARWTIAGWLLEFQGKSERSLSDDMWKA